MTKYSDLAKGRLPRLRRDVAVATAAAVAGVGLLVLALPPVWRRAQAWKAARTLFDPLTWNPYRRNDLRLTYALADRHRPLSVLRRKTTAAPPVQEEFTYSHVSLARLERGGDQHGIATAYALAGDVLRARQILETLLAEDDRQLKGDLAVDLAAILAWKGHNRPQAFKLLDAVLRVHPLHPQAMWNRAVLLESLDLPVAAARQFRRVADLGERGWATEAAERAERLEKRWADSLARYQAALEAADALAQGRLPSEQLARAYPDVMREGIYRAIAAANTPRKREAVIKAADWLGPLQDGGTLGKLARDPDLERRFAALLAQPLTLQVADDFFNLATEHGDLWRQLKGWVLRAEVTRREGSPQDARQAVESGLKLCDGRFPEICLQLNDALALMDTDARDLQKAEHIALDMKRDSQVRAFPLWELRANERLLRLEEHRRASALARTFAEENALQSLDLSARWRAQHLLALLASAESELVEATRHLRRLQGMDRPRGEPPFDLSVTSLVQSLIQRGYTKDWPEADDLLKESLVFYRKPGSMVKSNLAHLAITEGRYLLVAGDREGGRERLQEAIERVGGMASSLTYRQRIEVPAYAALFIDAATNDEHERAFEFLGKMRRMAVPGGTCLVGVVEEHQRRVFLVRRSNGRTVVVIQPPEEAVMPRAPAPRAVATALTGCAGVAVLAAPPIFGQSGLLPADLSWAYLHGDPREAPADGKNRSRLVVTDVRPPESLELPRLALQSTAPSHPGERVSALVGWEATPSRVLEAMVQADEVDLHVHGVLSSQVSDVPALVFSPDDNGDALLTARDLAGLELPRHPVIMLAACHAARGAPYGSVHASLPAALMAAGARAVFAAATPIEDSEAAEFFDAVRERMARGIAPAVALRDVRLSPRWQAQGQHWTRDVVLFQ